MIKVQFTRKFTDGTLKGLTHDDSITFVSIKAAQDWLARARNGLESPTGGSAYKVVADDLLQTRIIDYLERIGCSMAADTSAPMSQIAIALGVKAGHGARPHTAPLNQALIRLRDAGRIQASDNTWGEPRFTLA